jgi:hypothetical protein
MAQRLREALDHVRKDFLDSESNDNVLRFFYRPSRTF